MRLGGQFEIGPTFLFGSGYAGLGDFHYEHVEYDDAISSHQAALKLDPSNAAVKEKLQKAQQAEDTEANIER